MLILPSGRTVSIMSERARLHAAEKGIRIKARTLHAQLYPLVDILVGRPEGVRNGTQDLAFSGHTLGDRIWLGKWSAEDRRIFRKWIREPAQVRVIEHARKRLLADEEHPRVRIFDHPQHLYSVLRERIERMKMPRARPEQWRRTLRNLVRDGVRREELEWSGILDVLDSLPADTLVDKMFIAGAMDFSSIRPRLSHELVCAEECSLPFKEVVRKLRSYELQLAGLTVTDGDIGIIRFSCTAPAYKIGILWHGGRASSLGAGERWFVLGPYGEAIADGTAAMGKVFATQSQAMNAAQNHARRNALVRCNLVESARYDYMALHGGTQYREWLITLPQYVHTHFTGHFLERNILAHVRTKVRETQNGERVLFIEELQSDWHQARARGNVRGMIPRAPYKNEWAVLALKLMLMHAAVEGLSGIAWTDGSVHEQRYDQSLPPLRRLYDRTIPDALNALAKPWGQDVQYATFATRSPWLHAVRGKDAWRVEGGAGKFTTRARYTKTEAMRLIERHSKAIYLELPTLLFNDDMRNSIATYGLPLFGTKPLFPKEG